MGGSTEQSKKFGRGRSKLAALRLPNDIPLEEGKIKR
jgi:hypothetical protein